MTNREKNHVTYKRLANTYFTNKVALITGGGGSGIGHELVKAFANHGAHVAFCDIANLETTISAIGNLNIKSYSEIVDIRDKDAIQTFINNVISSLGHIDIVVNNAGIALGDRHFDELTLDDFKKITDINYWGVVHTTKLCYAHLLKRPEAAIVNISSSQGILGAPYLVPYCTTKFAVRGFTDSLRAEHKLRGINNVSVHTVHPGAVATNITINADYHGSSTEEFHKHLQENGTRADKAAEVILKGIRKKTGRIFISDGRFQDIISRLFPTASAAIFPLVFKLKKMKVR